MKANGGGWCIWLTLTVCAAVVLGAMTWLTRNVVASERERAAAESRANLQENMRLALWRMDTAGSALMVDESQRPVAVNAPESSSNPAGLVKMRFELSETGSLSSTLGESHLPDLRRLLRDSSEGRAVFTALCGSLEASGQAWSANKVDPVPAPEVQQAQVSQRDNPVAQDYYNSKERAVRGKAVDSQVLKASQGGASAANSNFTPSPPPGIPSVPSPERLLRDVGPMRPTWLGNELFLLRSLTWNGSPPRGGKTIQGVWFDASVLKSMLLAEARDLLPTATLVRATPDGPDGMVLASFPWRLEAGAPPPPAAISRPIAISLTAGWVAALVAIAAASLLVRGVMRLSERRASFVSAVTHELRTPLTTFRLYSDMLEVGAVKEEKRGDYLRVLSREADRLSHLVENVLAFSGIERGSARTSVRETTARDLLDPMRERFTSRLASAGMSLDMDLSDAAASRPLRVDAAAVEHVLFNLVDNAAKYAARGTLVIRTEGTSKGIAIRVTDHGPGIPPGERKRIFRAFHKSARDAAETRPGVGLGLALSRRLARAMHGDLTFEDAAGHSGASFLLTLPS